MFITENMYAHYKYNVDDDFNNGDKYFVNSDCSSGNGIGILFPVVIKKTASETENTKKDIDITSDN